MAQLTDDCFAFGGPMLTVDEAGRIIAERVAAVPDIEQVTVASGEGRYLAADVIAPIPLPPFANSAVDGYAVAHAALNPDEPTRLRVVARAAAGQAEVAALTGRAAIRVFTGAAMPAGADTVFMQEDVEAAGAEVVLPKGLKKGANSRPAGEDVAQGSVALPAGRRLRPQDLALAAALGLTHLPVRRRPRVGVFSTGDELTEPGRPLGPSAIYDSNRVLLASLCTRAGAEVVDLGVVRDRKAELAARLKAAAQECDLILTSGGVSTGEEDHVKPAVEEIGRLVFWRVGIKPGRPVALGVIDGAAFVGLPGNPVAVFVTFAFVARPLLARLAGGDPVPPRRIPVHLAFPYRKKAGRREYVRVRLTPRADGGFDAHKHPRDGAGVLSSLTETDGLVELPEDVLTLQAGDRAAFVAYADLA